jgi:hypothetical protein
LAFFCVLVLGGGGGGSGVEGTRFYFFCA